jgi:UDPglucose--hexose-1-phosphate uridylyltransferase
MSIVPELRKDPIVERWVLIAPSRADRPGAFIGGHVAPAARHRSPLPDCPFCVGNESHTPPAVCEQLDEEGRWIVRIVPNKYPAVLPVRQSSCSGLNRCSALGVHEVVIESARHVADAADLGVAEFSCVVHAWRDRIAEHRRANIWQHVLLFKNSGRAAGASLEHVHSQLVAQPRVPAAVRQELAAADAWHREHGGCVFCRLIADEREAGARVLVDREGFLAMTAVAGRQPYETWILPAAHEAAYDWQLDAQLERLAAVLSQVLQALRQVLTVNAYNLILHTAPFDTRWNDRYHWHMEIIPRISGLAGFELGGGEYINPVCPERAAEELNGILAANHKL